MFYCKTFSICKKDCNIKAVPIRQEEVESASHAAVKEPRESEEEESTVKKKSDFDVLALSLVVWGGHLKHWENLGGIQESEVCIS